MVYGDGMPPIGLTLSLMEAGLIISSAVAVMLQRFRVLGSYRTWSGCL